MPFILRGIAPIAILTLTFTTNYNASAESLTVTGDLNVQGIVKIGNNAEIPEDQLLAGTIRWTGFALEAYDGVSWKPIPISVFAKDGSARWGSDTNSVTGLYSTVWGFENTVDGLLATAWGRNVNAPSFLSTAFGKYNIGSVSFCDDENDTNDGNTVWIITDPVVEVGVGDGNNSRANALTLLKDGRIALGRHSTLDELQSKLETLQVQGALKVGDYSENPGDNVSEGAIRYNDNDLLVHCNTLIFALKLMFIGFVLRCYAKIQNHPEFRRKRTA